jgi:hypothetical protein
MLRGNARDVESSGHHPSQNSLQALKRSRGELLAVTPFSTAGCPKGVDNFPVLSKIGGKGIISWR